MFFIQLQLLPPAMSDSSSSWSSYEPFSIPAELKRELNGYTPELGMKSESNTPTDPDDVPPGAPFPLPEPDEWQGQVQHRRKRILLQNWKTGEWYYQYHNYWWNPRDWFWSNRLYNRAEWMPCRCNWRTAEWFFCWPRLMSR